MDTKATPSALPYFLAVCWLLMSSSATEGSVVVLANRTSAAVNCRVSSPEDRTQELSLHLQSAQVQAIDVDGSVQLTFRVNGRLERYTLEPYGIYFFAGRSPQLDLHRLELLDVPGRIVEAESSEGKRGLETFASPHMPEVQTLSVKVLVDDQELGTARVWQPRIQSLLDEASEILERHVSVRLEIASIANWETDNDDDDFDKALAEFEQEVDPEPARLAIGFSRQYTLSPDQFARIDGVRAPYARHVLIPVPAVEASLRGDAELEMLLHQLGHFFGAVHSPELDSVMRMELHRRASGLNNAIRFDPVNTLIMNLLRPKSSPYDDGIRSLAPDDEFHLQQAYRTLAAAQADEHFMSSSLFRIDKNLFLAETAAKPFAQKSASDERAVAVPDGATTPDSPQVTTSDDVGSPALGPGALETPKKSRDRRPAEKPALADQVGRTEMRAAKKDASLADAPKTSSHRTAVPNQTAFILTLSAALCGFAITGLLLAFWLNRS